MVLPTSVQQEKIKDWENFWNLEKVNFVKNEFIKDGKKYGFKEEIYNQFFSIFDKAYKKNVSHIVMEASSQALAMDRCDYINYDAAIFTNLTEDHLDYHIDMKNYLKAKLKLFSPTFKLFVPRPPGNTFPDVSDAVADISTLVILFGTVV